MAVKSVVTISVNDTDFQRYAATFAKYNAALQAQPGIWNNVNQAAGATATSAQQIGSAIGAAQFALNRNLTVTTTIGNNAAQTAGFWSSIAQSAGKFTSRVVEATRSLLRWGELTGLISGILGGGGLYGIDRMATSAATQRQRAFQLGATPGEVSGANIELARFTDPQAFMSSVNEGISHVTSDAFRAMMQLGVHPEDRTDAATTGLDTILALKGKLDQIPVGPMFGTTVDALKYTSLMPFEDIKKLRETPRVEVETQVARGREDINRFQLTPDQTKIWQELETTFDRVSKALKHDLTVRLTELAPALEHLSNSFLHVADVVLNNPHMEEWLNKAAGAMDRFAKYLTGDNVDKDIDDMMGKIDGVFTDIGRVVKEIPEIVDAFSNAVKAIKNFFADPLGTIKEGGVNGPFENPLNDPGSSEFNDKRDKKRHPEWYDEQGNLRDQAALDQSAPYRAKNQDRFSGGTWNQNAPDRAKNQDQLFGDHGTWNQNAQDRAKNQMWLRKMWDQLWGGAAHAAELPRGIRNNNPLNLSYVPGQEGALGSDDRFGVYETPEAGIAASERQLTTYQDKYGLDSIAEILSKWAPPSENDTAGYIEQVSKETGFKPNQHLDLHDRDTMQKLVSAMIAHETGRHMDSDVVQRGVNQGMGGPTQMAAGPKFVPPAAIRAPVVVKLYPEPGANPYISTSQLAY